MSPPAHIPLIPFLTLQSLLSSGIPHAWPLELFCAQVLDIPELSEAPVRVVCCHRQRVHEFILINCDVTTPAHDTVPLWLRIERHPDSQGVGVLLNKPKPAMDTVRASTDIEALRGQSEPRDYFMFNPHDKPREVLKLKNVAEMCRYFTGHAGDYSLFGANCRWICYVLLECLRESRSCYGGTLFPSGTERPTADVRAAQLAKSHYLKDKHSACCGRQYMVYPNLGAQIARAGMSWTSIAIAKSGQSTDKRDSQHEVLYRTPESVLSPPKSSAVTTDGSSNLGAGVDATDVVQRISSNNVPSSNATESPSRPNKAQPERLGDVSPIPTGANATQTQTPPAADNTPHSPQHHQHTTTPPINHAASQPSGDMSVASHCLSCQCTSHSYTRDVPSNPQNGHTFRSSISEPRRSNVLDLGSRFSSMNIGSEASMSEVSYMRSAEGNIPVSREPSKQYSSCVSHRSISAHPVASHSSASAPANITCNSPGSVCSVHAARIHPETSRPTLPLSTNTGLPQRNSVASMTTQCSGYHGQCSARAEFYDNSPSPPIPRSTRIPTGVNAFDAPDQYHHQRHSQLSCSNSALSTADAPTGCVTYQHRASSTSCTNCSSQDLIGAQECHHARSHPLMGGHTGPSRPIARGAPSPHGRGRPYSTHEISHTPTYQGSQQNHQAHGLPNPRDTRDPYGISGDYLRGPSSLLPRNSGNTDNLHHFQVSHGHTPISPLPLDRNANMSGDHYRFAPPAADLYSIPEGAPQVGPNNLWGFMNELTGASQPLEYNAQSALPNHVQSLHGSNLPLQGNFGHQHPQQSGVVFQESYMSNEAPMSLYSQLEQPARQWTQTVWADQGLGLPLRTDSPGPMEHSQTEGAYILAPGLTAATMPDHRDYMQPQDIIGGSVLGRIAPINPVV
ncbi:hypothetical protein RSOLAG1IB_00601 [Rhizoctonia solani AG-1 IB]|uniref:PPPDE domain-containing protein n=1 Tax=Thanatephorus cucumeris (strain AG1-IB / isolate 7/3/14) TaxID=1108050 RepID=A0A0B7F595_THACB|nr:hypothetical protein RSOLAG1IB_00601 [Rhizoctonia solani AG-1 IB]